MIKSQGFRPIMAADAKIMILGSMPGLASLKVKQYYGNKRNAFWWIMERLLGIDKDLPYEARVNLIQHKKIMLWDVIAACEREGSLDSNIKSDSIRANDLKGIFIECPTIKAVFLNGKTVETFFKQYIVKTGELSQFCYQTHTMPSTSPANARITKEQKLLQWGQILPYLD